MQDGFTQVGAGQDDRRLAGNDLQHNVQTRTADEVHVPVRMVRQQAEGGGPMKEHMEHKMNHGHHKLHDMLEMERSRHEHAKEHAHHHLERHHSRHHDTQYGHDRHEHDYGHERM